MVKSIKTKVLFILGGGGGEVGRIPKTEIGIFLEPLSKKTKVSVVRMWDTVVKYRYCLILLRKLIF